MNRTVQEMIFHWNYFIHALLSEYFSSRAARNKWKWTHSVKACDILVICRVDFYLIFLLALSSFFILIEFQVYFFICEHKCRWTWKVGLRWLILQTWIWIERQKFFSSPSAEKLNKPREVNSTTRRQTSIAFNGSFFVAAGDKKVEREKFFDLIFTIIASHFCIHSHWLTKCFARQFWWKRDRKKSLKRRQSSRVFHILGFLERCFSSR